jgi:hypothetical protein
MANLLEEQEGLPTPPATRDDLWGQGRRRAGINDGTREAFLPVGEEEPAHVLTILPAQRCQDVLFPIFGKITPRELQASPDAQSGARSL